MPLFRRRTVKTALTEDAARRRLVRSRIFGAVFYASLALLVVAALLYSSGGSPGAPPSIFGFSVLRVLSGSMQSELPKGALAVVRKTPPEELAPGDIITFVESNGTTTTHKIIDVFNRYSTQGYTGYGFRTRGTENLLPDPNIVIAPNVVGKVVFHTTLFSDAADFITDLWDFLLHYPVFLIVFPLIFIGLFIFIRILVTTEIPEPDDAGAFEGAGAFGDDFLVPPAGDLFAGEGFAEGTGLPEPISAGDAFADELLAEEARLREAASAPAVPVADTETPLSAPPSSDKNAADKNATDAETPLSEPRTTPPLAKTLFGAVQVVVIAAAVMVLLFNLLLPVYQINRTTMAPALRDGDVVVFLTAGGAGNGDVIAFYHGKQVMVKRVIAAAGDWVDIEDDGAVILNGARLYEPYVYEPFLGEATTELPLQVPDGQYFVMGDIRRAALDSRSEEIGLIGAEQVVGRALLRVWPLDRLGFGF
jgi:signal peptidase I